MKRLLPTLLLVLLASLLLSAAGIDTPALVRVDVDRPIDALGVPVLAHFEDADGQQYVLARLAPSRLDDLGLAYRVLDDDARGAVYHVALERRAGGLALARGELPVLLDDGRRLVVRAEAGVAERLHELGFAVSRLNEQPLVLRRGPRTAFSVTRDDGVQELVDAVDEATLWDYDGDLSGENPIAVGGADVVLATRATYSGQPIEDATQYVYDHLAVLGIDVAFEPWQRGRNVVGTLPGTSRADEIVLVTAHLDDRPYTGRAPGADDNASGSTAVMVVAELFASRAFERTLRFVFFTGEEQGLLGSQDYAGLAASRGDDIVAVLNMDMIAWEEIDTPRVRLHVRSTLAPGHDDDAAIAQVFVDVVDAYGLRGELDPVITADGLSASDHSPFWSWGYPGLLAIEDDVADFNPHYHTRGDARQYLDMAYFTAFVRAAVGTAAHLAVPSAEAPLGPPTGLEARVLGPTRVRLRWHDHATAEDGFEIQVKTSGVAWRLAKTAGAEAEHTVVRRLEPETAYRFRVRAVSSEGRSDWSNRPRVRTPAEEGASN